MDSMTTDILEYGIVPVFPYFNSLTIQRLLIQDRARDKTSAWNGYTGLELMNILSAGKLLYAVGHYADAVTSQLFLTAFVLEVSLLFWLVAQLKSEGNTHMIPVRLPAYLSGIYFITLVLLLFYASYGR